MRFSNDQESIRLQVLRIFLIFHLRSLPRIKYFIHQQLYFYRFFWHFIDFRIIGILRLLGNIAQPFSLTVVKEGRFEWNPNTMKLQANLYTQHLLGVLFIYLLLVPRPWAVGTGHKLRRFFIFFLFFYSCPGHRPWARVIKCVGFFFFCIISPPLENGRIAQ